MNERALILGKSRSLVGVITYPLELTVDPQRPALILLNAGLVHRVGPGRLHVRLARRMAERGFVVVRFDFSGIGDSLPRADNLPYKQSTVLEVQEVMDTVTELYGINNFCLIGLSSGALVSLDTALKDSRVVGAGILNPHGFADSAEWTTHVDHLSTSRIYAKNLTKLDSWRKLLTGKTNYRRLGEALRYRVTHRGKQAEGISSVVDDMLPELKAFLQLNIRILLLFSQKDRSIDNFHEILGSYWERGFGRPCRKSNYC